MTGKLWKFGRTLFGRILNPSPVPRKVVEFSGASTVEVGFSGAAGSEVQFSGACVLEVDL
ncbi:MAG: hypothetical protein LUQ71_10175 [Methanoregula sp.]|nr:hypothetical protein [Methanoregula sp.]